jgi:uncharacterized small protein (DUF1192 family)
LTVARMTAVDQGPARLGAERAPRGASRKAARYVFVIRKW